MHNIEKIRWAKELIEGQTSGLQKVKLGYNSSPMIISDDKASIGMQMQLSMSYQENHYIYSFYSYARRSESYENAAELQLVINEFQAVADVLKQLERETFILTEEELDEWREELKQQELQAEQNNALTMGL